MDRFLMYLIRYYSRINVLNAIVNDSVAIQEIAYNREYLQHFQ